MALKLDHQIVEAINKALDSSIGVELAVSDIETFKRRYYAERRRMMDTLGIEIPLVCRIPPKPNTVWLVRSDREEHTHENERIQNG